MANLADWTAAMLMLWLLAIIGKCYEIYETEEEAGCCCEASK